MSYLDVIDFIMKMEKGSKRAAILKAKELLGDSGALVMSPRESSKVITATYPVSKEDYASSPRDPIDFSIYRKALERSKSAQEYCGGRGLDWSVQEIGYQSRKSVERWGRGCIIFPLRNVAGEVVSLYGRSTVGQGHYYQSDRSGLYPSYPPIQTRTLVLCESVIDAASLERVRLDLSSYSEIGRAHV